MKWLNDLITEADNQTVCFVRLGAAAAVIQALGLTLWDCIHNGVPFSAQTFGIGMGAVFTGAGVAINMKKDTEHQP